MAGSNRKLGTHIFHSKREAERANRKWGEPVSSQSPLPGMSFSNVAPSITCLNSTTNSGSRAQMSETRRAISHSNLHSNSNQLEGQVSQEKAQSHPVCITPYRMCVCGCTHVRVCACRCISIYTNVAISELKCSVKTKMTRFDKNCFCVL